MAGGPSIVSTRKAVADETFIRKSTNLCNSIVVIVASQLYPYSMCQPMPTGLCTRWNYDTESQKIKPRQNETRSFENMVLSYFQQSRPECKIESNVTTGRQKKIDCFSVDGICYHCNTVFEAMGCYFQYCPCQEARPSLTGNDIMRGIKRDNNTKCVKKISNRKDTKLLKCGSASGGNYDATVKNHLRAIFPYQRPLSEKPLMQRLRVEGCLVTFNATSKLLNI